MSPEPARDGWALLFLPVLAQPGSPSFHVAGVDWLLLPSAPVQQITSTRGVDMSEPEDRFIKGEKVMPRPPISHVSCPWCGVLVSSDSGQYIEHVRDCREERGEAN